MSSSWIFVHFGVVLKRHGFVLLLLLVGEGLEGSRAWIWPFVCDCGAGQVMLGASQASGQRGPVLGSAAAGVVLVQVVG